MQNAAKIRPTLVLGAAAVALVLGFAGGFVFKRPSTEAAPSPVTSSASAANPQVDSTVRYLIPVSDTQPQRGPADALVTVVEWCDLRGDPCREADKAMSQLMAKYPGRLRWVHRSHIDPDNFAQSQRLHSFARGVFQSTHPGDHEKFWQARAKLLALPGVQVPSDDELRRIARELDLDYETIEKGIAAKSYTGGLAIDSKFEPRFGIDEAPAFFVNGRRVALFPKTGMQRSIDTLIQQEMVVAKHVAERGVKGAALYDEITKDGLWAMNEDRGKRPPPRVPTQISTPPRSN